MNDIERGLTYALRQHGQPAKQHTSRAPGLRVTLSVRHPDGGRPFRFEYRVPTISHLDAEIQAKAAAQREGLRPWALLEIVDA